MYEHLRKFPRLNFKNVLRVGPLSGSGEEQILLTRVIGGGGCHFFSSKPYGVGKILAIHLLLFLKTIKATAKVVWESPNDEGSYEVGVEFGTLSPEDQAALAKFLSIKQTPICNT